MVEVVLNYLIARVVVLCAGRSQVQSYIGLFKPNLSPRALRSQQTKVMRILIDRGM